MRFPIGKSGTREEVENDWYVAGGFGEYRSDGGYYHSGIDWNLKTGGDTDLGQPIYAPADGKVVSYHNNTHLNSGFGRHAVMEMETPFGLRWFGYCHCDEKDFDTQPRFIKEGQLIARVGKTGRPNNKLPAHLHAQIWLKTPLSFPNGIDTIAKTKKALLDTWEDPLAFFNKWYNYQQQPQPNDMVRIEQIIIDGYKALTGENVNDDEKTYRINHWENTLEFLKGLTGDRRFYGKYVKPQLDGLKRDLDSAYNKEIAILKTNYQKEIESAKNAKVEDLELLFLLKVLVKKIGGG